ncbi:MAG: uncharacterized membrane protein YgdD (TMEM256/DUF423 family) [Cellvibrionaceae bacterium]|jgi:uncharacterized membrane protein YgdD (TMEM256/DUF423 family)
MVLVFGALLGFISVAFGAYAEHGLRESVSDEHFRFLMTAVRYNQLNAVVISTMGLGLLNGGKLSAIPALKWSSLLFVIGTVLFSFSIYVSVSFEIPWLVYVTPVGGVTIMAAWLLLLIAGLLATKNK